MSRTGPLLLFNAAAETDVRIVAALLAGGGDPNLCEDGGASP